MRLVLLGPPGAGKGTQAGVLSKSLGLLHVSTGDMLREAVKAGTEAGKSAKKFMDSGELVPDEIVTKIVTDRISKEDAKSGFMLDGFPRNTSQGVELDRQLDALNMPLELVLFFNTGETTSVERLTGRRVCKVCGRNFHVKNMPPKVEGKCDSCGGQLIQRDDDKVDTIMNRLKVYQKQTEPLLKFYKEKGILREVSGDLDVDTLFGQLKELFKKENL